MILSNVLLIQVTIMQLLGLKKEIFKNTHLLGFTLIELLIVISITSILTIVGIANFKDFADEQAIVKATGQIQSFLRLAHRNASSSVKCTDTEAAASWLVTFQTNKNTLTLICKSPTSETTIKNLNLASNVEINQITTNPICPVTEFPDYTATLIYSAPLGQIDFTIARGVPNFECYPNTSDIKVTVKDNKTQVTKDITVSKGGEINVE